MEFMVKPLIESANLGVWVLYQNSICMIFSMVINEVPDTRIAHTVSFPTPDYEMWKGGLGGGLRRHPFTEMANAGGRCYCGVQMTPDKCGVWRMKRWWRGKELASDEHLINLASGE